MKDGQTIGQWLNWDFDTNGILTIKDKRGFDVYQEYSTGYWLKREFDLQCKVIYFEGSDGVIRDSCTPEVKVIKKQRKKIPTNP